MKARQLALGGLQAALASVLLLLGGLIPAATYVAPMLASALLLPLRAELPERLCVGWYAVVSLLALLLCPDPETALVFVFLGWYPVAKPALDRLPTWLRVMGKLLLFNLCVGALYALLIWVLQLQDLVEQARQTATPMLAVLLLMGNLCFLLFDRTLDRVAQMLARRQKQSHRSRNLF